MYVRKEAVLSSQIEGTQSSLSDLLLYEAEEAPGVPLDDVREVSNYVAAMDHGLARLREGFPLSLRLLREIHAILLARGRGEAREPGEFRRSQNWIGGTRPGNAVFVPPPAHEVMRCMGDLERFLHAGTPEIPTLVKAGLAHVQFETIHPFLDGNGRLGRLLITLFLCERGVLREPLLYLSLYFKVHRSAYYELLQAVRETGDWERWLDFFPDRRDRDVHPGNRRRAADPGDVRGGSPGDRSARPSRLFRAAPPPASPNEATRHDPDGGASARAVQADRGELACPSPTSRHCPGDNRAPERQGLRLRPLSRAAERGNRAAAGWMIFESHTIPGFACTVALSSTV
jgi:hypothetical protein